MKKRKIQNKAEQVTPMKPSDQFQLHPGAPVLWRSLKNFPDKPYHHD